MASGLITRRSKFNSSEGKNRVGISVKKWVNLRNISIIYALQFCKHRSFLFFFAVKRIHLTIERKQLNKPTMREYIFIYKPLLFGADVSSRETSITCLEPIIPLISKGSEPVSKGCERAQAANQF